MAGAKKLVIGASGFLGSHVTRQLVDRGDDVRVLIRRTSSTKAIEDLDNHYGDIFDDAAVRTAMAGCDDVFYCVVDTRAWLRDPAPLYRTNVDGLRHVLDAAVDADLRRFVFTSTNGTIGIRCRCVCFGDTLMRRPLAGFGFWPRRFGPRVGGVLQKLRRRRVIRRRRHGLYQPWWLARVPMGPWS
jgi:nucleoside-diphosphate-sugar epimerase